MIELRPYQETFVGALRDAFRQHRRVLGVAPTGAGKTACFAYITSQAARKAKHIIIVGHRSEIVEQISGALDRFGVRHGRIQPGHKMTEDRVQVGMVQTIARRLAKVSEPDLLVIDEAHHAVAGTWETICKAWGNCLQLGVTATPQRLDGRGLGDAFDHMVIGPTVSELIAGGFLAPYEYLAPPAVADLSGVGTRMGDFKIDELAQVMDRAVITGDAVTHYRRYLDGRPAIAFCVSVAHAEHVAEQFRSAGYRADSVDGSLEASVRRERIASIGDGRLNVLTSCDLISEGTDIPIVAGAIMLRPTKSLSMCLQQAGRVLRPKPDGSKAIILDHVGNVHRHGLPDADREWSLDKKAKKKAASTVATCKACFQVFMVKPGWRDDPCGDEPGCIFAERDTAPDRAELEVIDGELTKIDPAVSERIAYLRKTPLSVLMAGARSREDIAEIAKARGYKPGWVFKVMAERERLRGGKAA